MADYCGTADCLLISRDWSDLTLDGTTNYAGDIITAASEWVDAIINDWHCAVNPLTSGGTLYDYWVEQATANRAVYVAYDSVMRDKDTEESPYWDAYKVAADTIMGSLRAAHSTMSEDTSIWERGIAPALGVANGTVTAPYTGVMLSNARIASGVYTADDEIPRTFVVELDGTGTVVDDQTYRWMYKGGTSWEEEDNNITINQWESLTYGVRICFPSQANAAVETGEQWEVACFPARGGNFHKSGFQSWDINLG